MGYTCTDCEATFESAGGVTQHVALHHQRCALCDEQFTDLNGLRTHVHEAH